MRRHAAADEPRSIVGYVRVSTKEQAETKLSLTHQEEKIRAYAIAQDLKLSHIFNDAAESAKDLNRTAVKELLAEIEKGRIEHVIILKLDRLVRNVENLGYLLRLFEKKGVTLSAVQESLNTSTASGRMVVNLLGAIAEWERDTIAERTVAALAVKRSKSEKLGGIVPYGYRIKYTTNGTKLVPEQNEYGTLRWILEKRRAKKGYQEIAQTLNGEGVHPRAGKRWYASTIRAICLRDAKEPRPTATEAGKGSWKGSKP